MKRHRAHRHIPQGRCHGPGPQGGHKALDGHRGGLPQIGARRLREHIRLGREAHHQVPAIAADQRRGQGASGHGRHREPEILTTALEADALETLSRQRQRLGAHLQGPGAIRAQVPLPAIGQGLLGQGGPQAGLLQHQLHRIGQAPHLQLQPTNCLLWARVSRLSRPAGLGKHLVGGQQQGRCRHHQRQPGAADPSHQGQPSREWLDGIHQNPAPPGPWARLRLAGTSLAGAVEGQGEGHRCGGWGRRGGRGWGGSWRVCW